MRLWLFAMLVFSAACGDTSVDPDPDDIAGQYKLVSIAGSTLPRNVMGSGCTPGGLICVRASELWLTSDGTYVWWFYSDSDSSLLDEDGYFTSEGDWEIDGRRLVLTEPDGTTREGRAEPDVTLELPGGMWLYRPR